MSFPAYELYRASNVPGIGNIPEHWSIGRLGYLLDLLVDGTHHSPSSWPEGDYKYITAKNIKELGFDFSELTYVTGDDHEVIYSRCPVQKDDVLYIKDGATAGIAMVNPLEEQFSLLSSVAVIRPIPNVLLPSFVRYHLNAGSFKDDVLNRLVGGAMPRFTLDMISRFHFGIPPCDEQRAIARFLDIETSKIDALVAEQRRLIELLKEKRQAVISHAVTKGLDPNVKMKPSGIDWAGTIPTHWRTPPVFARYYAVLGKMVDDNKRTGFHPVPYLRNADVNWDSIQVVDLPVIDIKPDEYVRFTLKPGDLLICEGGAGIGQTAIWNGEIESCAFQKALHRLRPWHCHKENPRFFYYCMRYIVEAGVVLAGGTATIPHLTGEQLRKYRFPTPPYEEQNEIVVFLDTINDDFNSLITEANRAITLLQERRTALISAAVTGKIDVRSFVSKESA